MSDAISRASETDEASAVQHKLSEGDTVFAGDALGRDMEWTPTATPAMLNACDCGSDDVEVRPDGLVKLYRCADCETILGDITMGHEP